MSSILTNNSAMVALQTLKSINNDLGKVQSEISTGKTVASAKDNAATWAISKVMSSDVEGFKAISDSLSLGSSTVGVALNGAEGITDLLTEIKGKIVNAQEENVDRDKIQTDIEALRDQIQSISGAAQFNGLNLLSNTESGTDAAGSGTSNILSSLDRAGDGTVAASNIAVAKQDLGTGASAIDFTATAVTAATDIISVGGAATQVAVAQAGAAAPTADVDAFSFGAAATDAVEAGTGFQIMLSADGGALDNLLDTADGDITFVARDGDTAADVATALADKFNAYVTEALGENATNPVAVANGNSIEITPATGVAADTFSINAEQYAAADTTIGGRLEALNEIDVSTAAGAESALAEIETLIQTSIDAAASLGSDGKRIETQNEFVGKLMDGLKSGIGSLVDADMEAASAKLQALQTQQQLGVQALSIANQAPQTILSLFR
ncbi:MULTISPECIES: flagellin [Roseobacter]|uniref:Flagellin n=1 Tax=Roseobacter litoralis (strain ATCC 49566 / DSM 6996 / JCM 21268 / NBRC 15278 / OCh 149) TaxID=391595 RepID=F7ZIC3_ROSLO|nr:MULTISPECIES: flagellin [Roseobacter]AEI96259.1 flagellin protein [Roseobacter litoralis Och 149]GIT86498.1 flagellin [Roseobacter sp. OBYS 0001]